MKVAESAKARNHQFHKSHFTGVALVAYDSQHMGDRYGIPCFDEFQHGALMDAPTLLPAGSCEDYQDGFRRVVIQSCVFRD